MRTKSFVLFLICVVATSIFLILVGNQRPSIQTIVTETHKQLNNLKNFKENLENAEEKRFLADDKYLTMLGFTDSPRLYPAAIWKNTSLPIIVTYVLDGHEQQGIGFSRNVAHFLPNHTTLIYNLGLGQYGLQMLQGHCNSSRCSVVNFELNFFPSHVEEERLHAFRPLVIQDALNKAGAVLFLESDQRLITGHLEPLIQQALRGAGVVSWATHYATSSLTHPKMFDYFHTNADSFLFLPMVEATRLLFYNLPGVHNGLILPWVQCALTQDCVLPIGAQSGGCRFNKKPQYRYSGCHRYDGSALNIALGLKFGFDEGQYTYKGREKFFRKVGPDVVAAEMAGLDGNATEPTIMTRDGI
ncbi:uncharacterized protein LOC110832850 [Zootermopsis nevadensis]|uniref:Uncharacterized protein n=1 Tax=Zootermopsis nevadensis TaxID=136037 RepID=A0A067R2F0_ZOONE|nr:uncharacterized protein LOC110832850 [Zootermopsis nevadensis]KDR16172.1 hypothetical protein L798_09586 [Zootermopsis nevadensis]